MENEMKYIYAIYEHGSFSKAAEALYLTQPALSTSVQKVEARIGMPLFDRTHKPLELTDAGRLYIKKYYQIRDLERELEEQLGDISSLQTGSLRIGGTHYFHSVILPPVLSEFIHRYPGVQLELKEAASDVLLEMLYEHDIDLTFNCIEKPKDTFRRQPCFIDTILLCVPSAFPVNKQLKDVALSKEDIMAGKHRHFDVPTVSLRSFADTPFILLTEGNDLYTRSIHFFEEAGVKPDVRLKVSQLATSFQLSCSGIGAAFISDYLVNIATEDALFYKISESGTTRVFDLVMSDRHYISGAMQAFSGVFREYYNVKLPERRKR